MRKSQYVFVLLTLVSACGRRSAQTSDTSAIVTNLNDSTGQKVIQRYWLDGSSIKRGICTDPEIFTDSLCRQNFQSMDYSVFKKKLDGGLSDSVRELEEKAKQLKAQLTKLEQQIEPLRLRLKQLEEQGGELSEEAKTIRTRLDQSNVILSELKTEVADIEDQLRNARDQELERQRDNLVNKLTSFQANLGRMADELKVLNQQIEKIKAQISDLEAGAKDTLAKIKELTDQVAKIDVQLKPLRADLMVYDKVIGVIARRYSFECLESDPRQICTDSRKFIKRFDAIFDGH